MHTSAPEQTQVHSVRDSDSQVRRESSEPYRVLGKHVLSEFRGKVEVAELWAPERDFQTASRIAALVATLVAYPIAYRAVTQLLQAHLGPVSSRDVVLGGVVLCFWVLLGEVSVLPWDDKSPRLRGWFWREGAFVSVVGAAYLAGMTSTLLSAFIGMSVVYIPVAYVIHAIARHIAGSIQLIPPDARIVVVASKGRAKEAMSELRKANCRYEIVGYLDPDTHAGGADADVAMLGFTDELPAMLFRDAIDMVLFAVPLEDVPNVDVLISAASEIGVPVGIVLASAIDKFTQGVGERQSPSCLRFPVIVALCTIRRERTYLAFKRILDICVSGLLLVALAPLLIILAVLVKVTSPGGPILYSNKVLGRNRRPFVGYKFRTMVPNADQLKAQLMHRNEMTGPVFKIKNDPRVTPLGRILRKFSFDELPQLYSVLKGDLSLVGPRAPSKQEADQFEYWQRRKLSVTQGITCLWQINGRNQISSFDQWARLDLEYIANASFRTDLRILLRTIPAVISAKGAH